jgi:hypothetical protein
MTIRQFLDRLTRSPTTSKFYSPISYKNVLDENFSAKTFTLDQTYFEICLSEMFLRDKREYTRGFIPLSVAISEFLYDGNTRNIPFFVGNNLLQRIEDYIKGEYIEHENTRIVGPVPYAGDNVSLFVGLFRVQVSDLFKGFLSFAENICNFLDVSQVSKYVDIAGLFSSNLQTLLGMREMELRLGRRNTYTSKEGDSHQFKPCYLAYINCPERALSSDDLYVQEAKLFTGKDKDSITPLRDFDYCLVKIDHLVHRDDYTKFPFHELWVQAKELVWDEKEEEAKARMQALGQQMAGSPDLTTSHRHDLIRLYRANLESEIALFRNRTEGKSEEVAPVRSAWRSPGQADGPKAFERAAYLVHKAGYSEDLEDGLLEISKNWQQIPYLAERAEGFELTDKILGNQLKRLQEISKQGKPNPKGLADALAVASLRST